jgi:hypothetical protein
MLELAHHILLVRSGRSGASHKATMRHVMLMDLIIAVERRNCADSD